MDFAAMALFGLISTLVIALLLTTFAIACSGDEEHQPEQLGAARQQTERADRLG